MVGQALCLFLMTSVEVALTLGENRHYEDFGLACTLLKVSWPEPSPLLLLKVTSDAELKIEPIKRL
jgi:hypothetical protein